MESNKRKYPRIPTKFLVNFFRDAVDKSIRQSQDGVVENYSAGGMFIATDHPFSRGSMLNLEFELGSEKSFRKPIQARAIVRWVQRLANHPGMGVEFVLFNGFGKHEFEQRFNNIMCNVRC